MEEVQAAASVNWAAFLQSLATLLMSGGVIYLIVDKLFSRRKDRAEANQADTDYRKGEMELIASQIKFNKEQLCSANEQITVLQQKLKDLNTELDTTYDSYNRLEAKVTAWVPAVQLAFTNEVRKKKSAEKLYCQNDICDKRKPPIGKFSTPTDTLPDLDINDAKRELEIKEVQDDHGETLQ